MDTIPRSDIKKELLRSFKFLVFSCTAGVIQVLSFTLLHELADLPYWPAYLAALLLSVLYNFTLNRRLTFRSAANVPLTMGLVLGYYALFTPLSTWGGYALTHAGWNEYLVLAVTMVLNFVTEFLFCRFVVYRNNVDNRETGQAPAWPRPRQPEREKEYGEKLARMVRIPTLSREPGEDMTEFFRLQALLEELFPRFHHLAEKRVCQGSLVYRWKGKEPGPGVMVMAHQDVVPAPDEGWIVPPFSGEIREGLLYGRGALDCKATLFSLLQALEELAAEGFSPVRDIWVTSSCNEETSTAGAFAVAELLRRQGVTLDWVLDEGGSVTTDGFPGLRRPMAMIGIMEKGFMNVEIAAAGKGGHSSRPSKGSPIPRLAAFISRMERRGPLGWKLTPEVAELLKAVAPDMPLPARLVFSNLWFFRPLLPRLLPRMSGAGNALIRTTCAFTMAEGSPAANVLPQRAWVTANLRNLSCQSPERVMEILRKTARGLDLTCVCTFGHGATPPTPTDGAPYRRVAEVFREIFPDAGTVPSIMLGGTDSRAFVPLTRHILRVCPLRVTPEQQACCHAANENISLSSLPECVDFYKALLRDPGCAPVAEAGK